MLSLLQHNRGRKSSDSRDKIYGIFRMHNGDEIPIVVDYNETPATVYVDFIRSFDRKLGNFPSTVLMESTYRNIVHSFSIFPLGPQTVGIS